MKLSSPGAVVPCLLGSFAATAAADVLVVDAFGNGDHLQIYEAVAAASSGDTILVRAGSYISFTIDGKSLVVTREPGAYVGLDGMITVRNLPAGGSVVLRGFSVAAINSGSPLVIADCAGSVRIEDSLFSEPYLPQFPVPGATLTSSADVTFVRCTLRGTRGLSNTAGAHGLSSTSSNVALYDTNAIGGVGSAQIFNMFGPPGDGVRLDGGSLFASGGKLEGGRGWDGALVFGCVNAGIGAPGLRLRGLAPTARLRSTTLVGGAAGTPAPPCLPGSSAPGQIVESGSLTIDPRAARSLAVDGPLHPGDTLVATLSGEPGDLAHVLVALPATGSPPPSPAQALLGTAGLPAAGAGALFSAAFLDGSGHLQLSAAVPAALPLASGALTIELQAVMLPATLPRVPIRSNPELVTFLDPGF